MPRAAAWLELWRASFRAGVTRLSSGIVFVGTCTAFMLSDVRITVDHVLIRITRSPK